jgi:dTDP-L-rhamnose 4-epimerase
MTVCPTIGIDPVAFRYQNVYGPGQSLSNPYTGILSIFSNLAMSGKTINVFEDGKESRDFVFIDDVIDATVLGIERDGAKRNVFNVGYGSAVDVLTVAKTIARHINPNVNISISGDFRLGDIRHNFACLRKVKEVLGFSPKYNFERGVALFCQWASTQGAKNSDFERSLGEMASRGLLRPAATR